MKVLVTGGAGFIGSHVADAMVEAGHQVSIVDSLWKRGGGKLENLNPKARFYAVDVRDPGRVPAPGRRPTFGNRHGFPGLSQPLPPQV